MRREFEYTSRFRIECRRQIGHIHAVQSAENALCVVSYLAGAIETGKFGSHRFVE
jgi:hypothetical protein